MPEEQRSCICGQYLTPSMDPSVLTVTRSSVSIFVQQPENGVYSDLDFEAVLRAIVFEYDPTIPSSIVEFYTALAHVIVKDRMLDSPVAATTVNITIGNQAPIVLLNGDVSIIISLHFFIIMTP